ncbi:MAG TPA: toll/interleukin-1 receptor domain-containing protein [Bryobacteraceae bacterium]|nr:toll/interleukin-1 receptor domain-containing protein [Bryobacteraceae bacterium]
MVDIDDLGVFIPGAHHGFRFVPETRPRVFIAYVHEDLEAANRLYAGLLEGGARPWIDKKKLLPGQNWPRAIETAIGTSDFFIPCFSTNAVSRRGVFNAELRYALECANRIPLDQIFIIPTRLDECVVPQQIRSRIHCVDLFPDWHVGLSTILKTIHQQVSKREYKRPA